MPVNSAEKLAVSGTFKFGEEIILVINGFPNNPLFSYNLYNSPLLFGMLVFCIFCRDPAATGHF